MTFPAFSALFRSDTDILRRFAPRSGAMEFPAAES